MNTTIQLVLRSFCLVLFLLATAAAQVQQPVHAREVFITMDADSVTDWRCKWSHFTARVPDQPADVIHFGSKTLGVPTDVICSGHGIWGPHFVDFDGNYVVEPFWLSATAGSLGGVFHVSDGSGNGSVGPAAVSVASNQRQGLRIFRIDGKAFTLEGIEYASAASDFEIGTELTGYESFAGYQSVTPILGSAPFTFHTLALPSIPAGAAGLELALAGAPLVFDTQSGTVTASGTIALIRHLDGTLVSSSAQAPLVGGSFTLAAAYTGSDLQELSDLSLNGCVLTLTDGSGAQLQVAEAAFQAQGSGFRFFGDPPMHPFWVRACVQPLPGTVARSGPASSDLDGWAYRLLDQTLTLQIRTDSGAPRIVAIDKNPPAPAPGPQHVAFALDNGGMAFGAYGLTASSPYRHLFAPNPAAPLGAGSFFGIPFDTFTLGQLMLPANTPPFRGQTTPVGAFAWSSPAGVMPPGLVCDVLFLGSADASGAALISSLARLTF